MGSPQYPPQGLPYPPQRPPYPQYPPGPPHAQHPPPYRGYPPPPPPPSFWRRQLEAGIENEVVWPLRHWKIFLPIFLVIAIALAIMGFFVTRVHEASDRATAAAVPANAGTPVSTVNGFLDALVQGSTSRMYPYLCTATKRSYSVDRFKDHQTNMTAVKSAQIGAAKPIRTASAPPSTPGSSAAVPWGTIEATFVFVNGKTEKHVFQLVTEDNGASYRICGDPY